MKKTIMTAMMFSMIVAGIFLVRQNCSAADAPGTAPQINLGISFSENIEAFTGKTVTVTLSSGQAISGIVKDVKNGLLHLEKLSQKDFFDAVIVVDKISAVEVRVR